MRVDPVLAIVDEIERAYAALAGARNADDWRATRGGLARIAVLHQQLIATEPSTVIGAACLLREAAGLLPQGHRPYFGEELREVATRFDEGCRRMEDLVRLRSLANELGKGGWGELGSAAAQMILLAVKGASRPVLLWHAVPARPRTPNVQASRTPAV